MPSLPLSVIQSYEGKKLGTGANAGECATGVQTIFEEHKKPLGLTKTWKKGAKVAGDAALEAGTAIATFKADGGYDHHAAVYDSQTATEVTVWDQYNGSHPKSWGKRQLAIGQGGSNGADDFYVITK